MSCSKGVKALIEVLRSSKSRMSIDEEGVIVRGNGGSILRNLDLSRNALGFESIQMLQVSVARCLGM